MFNITKTLADLKKKVLRRLANTNHFFEITEKKEKLIGN